MKPIVITVTPEILDKYTTSSSGVSGLSVCGKDVMSCTVPNHLTSFPQNAVKILELFGMGKADCELRRIHTPDDNFGIVTIKGNPDNGVIFELFRKFGILTGNLVIGFAGTAINPVIYTNAKMLKDISKFAPEVQAALAFSLINIAKVCSKVPMQVPEIELASSTSRISCDKSLDEFIVSFTNVKQIEIKELPTENYKKITYYNNKYSSLETTYTGAISYGLLAKTKSDGTYDFEQSILCTAISFSTLTYPILIRDTCISTNMDLTNFESAKDSYITALVTKYTKPIIEVYNVSAEDLKSVVPKDAVLLHVCEDDELEEAFTSEGNKELVKWNAKVKTGTREVLDAKVCTALNTFFGIKTSVTSTALDYDAMVASYAEDPYAQQLYTQVKKYYAAFDLGTLSANLKGFAKGDLYSMLFAGDSGTGKSTAARVLPARCGIPYISINFSVNIEESDIFGSMIPNTLKVSADDPEFVWQDGVLTKAIRNGYCAVLEEINFARPGVLGKLNSLLDENRQIDLPTGEILKAHPNFRIIATCNVAYEGTNRFNKALINRFDDCTVFKDVTRAKAMDIIKERTGYKNMGKLDVIYNVYEALKKYGDEQNLNLIVSMRQLLNIFSKGKYYEDANDAVKRIMLNGAFIEEPEYQEEFEKSILPAFKLNFKI
jgi:hypothetical protein